MALLPLDFEGVAYRLSNNWQNHIPRIEGPIYYLEIGTFYGANAISVCNSYAKHPESEVHCVDPWIDYPEYPEREYDQSSVFEAFKRNIDRSGSKDKIKIHRGFSHQVIPTFPDEYFDLIYLDGNHEPEYVLEDGVLAFRKLKKGGFLIFDDYGWHGPDETQRGIDAFISGYHKRIKNLGIQATQVFIQKIK
jgi:predicted O-methyltransferase YrrM